MSDFEAIVLEALRQLGAQEVFVPGAKLRTIVDMLAAEQDLDLTEYLDTSGLRFGQAVEQVPEVVVNRRKGSDMFVGLEGGRLPEPVEPNRAVRGRGLVRQDVYQAFTRVSEKAFYYIPAQDEFTHEPSDQERTIPVPPVTLAHLQDERRRFADSLDDQDVRVALTAAVDHTANPLSAFRREVDRNYLRSAWHAFRTDQLRARIEEWARQNDIEAREGWFRADHIEDELTPQQLLGQVAKHMTDEEVRALEIPFRVLEAMFIQGIESRQ